jgi:hypothetical protein
VSATTQRFELCLRLVLSSVFGMTRRGYSRPNRDKGELRVARLAVVAFRLAFHRLVQLGPLRIEFDSRLERDSKVRRRDSNSACCFCFMFLHRVNEAKGSITTATRDFLREKEPVDPTTRICFEMRTIRANDSRQEQLKLERLEGAKYVHFADCSISEPSICYLAS